MEAAQSYTRDELENKKYSELQKIGKALGIKGGRLKTDKLIEAILEAEVPDNLSEDAGNIATALAEAAVKEEEESMEAQDLKATDSLCLLEDIDFPDDDLLGDLQPTPAKTPGQHTKNGIAVATPEPQSSLKKRGRSSFLDKENAETPDLSNGTKRRRTETFEVDDEISFPNVPCQVDDEISFPKVVPSEKEEKVAENSQQLALLVSQLPSLTPAQVSKRRRGRGRKPVLAVNEGSTEKSPQIIQEITNTKDTKMPQLRRESTFDKETSYLTDSEGNNSEIKDQSIVREGTFVKDENNTLLRENTFTKDEPESKDSTDKLSNNDVEKPIEAIEDDIVTSDFVSEFVADTEESNLPVDDIITSDNVTEFVAQPTESATPEVSVPRSENISCKRQLSVRKSRSNIFTPSSARKSLASGSTPVLNRKSITISRRSVATPLKANNIRKSFGIMGIHTSNFKKAAIAGTPGGAKVVTPVTKISLTRKSVVTPVTKKSLTNKSIGTPLTKMVTPVTKINSTRRSIGTPLAGRKSISSSSQIGHKATTKEKTVSTVASKLVKPTFSIGRTAPVKPDLTNKHAAGSGIPRFVSYARKIKMPDFTKIHERAFKKMEALDVYQDKKHRRTRTVTAGGSNTTPKAKTPTAVTPVQVFTPSVTNVKNVNLNFAISAANKKSPNNSKSPKTLGKKTAAAAAPPSKKFNNSSTKNSSKSPKLVTKSPNSTVGKAGKSPKVISTKSPKMANKSPKISGKSPKNITSKPQYVKKEVTKSGIPTLKENVKPDSKSSITHMESKIPAPKIKVSSPKVNLTSAEPSKPINYRPYTGAIKPFHQRKTMEDLKNLAMKNHKIKSSVQVRAGQRSILKGVRINKRFELQMANRGFDLQLDS